MRSTSGSARRRIVVAELVRRGHRVLVPYGVNQRYDLVIDTGDGFLRAQCKTGRLRKGRVCFRTDSTRVNTARSFTRSYVGEIDLFLVYALRRTGSMLSTSKRLPRGTPRSA